MFERPLLDPKSPTPAVAETIANFHRRVIDEVAAAIESEPVVVVGMSQNPFVKRARKALEAGGVQFRYLEYGSYFSSWKERLAIKMWSGWSTFPQVFVRGRLIGGATDTERALADGSLRALLDG